MSKERVNRPKNDSSINNNLNSTSFFKQRNPQNHYESKRHGTINVLEYKEKFTRNEEPPNVNDEIELYMDDEKVVKITEPQTSNSTFFNSTKPDLSKNVPRKKSLKTKNSEPTSVNNGESSVSPPSTRKKCCSPCCTKSKQEASSSSMYLIPKLSETDDKVSRNLCPMKTRYIMLGGNRYSPARARRRYAKQRSAQSSRLQIQNLPKSVELMKVSSTDTIDINHIKNEIRLKLNNFNNISLQTIQATDTKKIMNETIEIPGKSVEESLIILNDSNIENFIPEETLPANISVIEDDITSIDKTLLNQINSDESTSTVNSLFTARPHILSLVSSTSSIKSITSAPIKSELTKFEKNRNKGPHPTFFCSISLSPKLARLISKKQNKKKRSNENFKRLQNEINQNYINYRQLSNRTKRKYTSARNIHSIENITRAIDNGIHKSVSLSKIDGLIKAFNTQINDIKNYDGNFGLFVNKGCQTIGERYNKQELNENPNKHMKFPSIDNAMQRTWEWVNNIENNIRADDISESTILSESNHESTWDHNCNLVNSTRLINENNTSQLENVESIPKPSESFEKMQLKLHQILHPETISSVEGTPLFMAQSLEKDCFVTDALKYLNSSEHIKEMFEKKNKIPPSNWSLYESLLSSERDQQKHSKKSSPKTTPVNHRYCCLVKIKNALRNLFLRRRNL